MLMFLGSWVKALESRLHTWWSGFEPKLKADIATALEMIAEDVGAFIEQNGTAMLAGKMTLQQAAAELITLKPQGITIGLNLARAALADGLATWQQTLPNPPPLVALPTDPPEVHAAVTAANTAAGISPTAPTDHSDAGEQSSGEKPGPATEAAGETKSE